MLIALLTVDGTFIFIHLVLLATGSLHSIPLLSVTREGGIPEIFNYLKWISCSVGCAWLFEMRGRDWLYLVWTFVFLYLLLDDAFDIHERKGSQIVGIIGLHPAFALRAKDFGEMIITAVVASAIFAAIFVAHFLSKDEGARRFSRNLVLWLIALAAFGVGVDMLHIMSRTIAPSLNPFLGVVEDGGEMVVASFITYAVWQEIQRAAKAR